MRAQGSLAVCLFVTFACGARQTTFNKSNTSINIVKDLNSDAPCSHFDGVRRLIDPNLVFAIAKSIDDDEVPIVKPSNAVDFGKAFADAKAYGGQSVVLHNLTSRGGSVFWLSPGSSALFCASYELDRLGNEKAFVRWIAFMQRH